MDDWRNSNPADILIKMKPSKITTDSITNLIANSVTKSEMETRELGRQIGEQLQPGMVVALDGTLGAGKTRLVQGIGIGLGLSADSIVSPTYTICIPYSARLPLLHLDAYRINELHEVDELGLDEAVEEGAVLVVEWAERIVEALPPIDLRIRMRVVDDEVRRIELSSPSGRWPS
jgi:tRNA threonylcarbamoyladenosine biosynthesis protein TsaE